MRCVFLLGLACVLGASAGCGGGGAGGASGTPDVKPLDADPNYGQAIRTSILSIPDAGRSEGGMSTVKGNVESLVESLSGYETKGGAAHKATYEEIEKT